MPTRSRHILHALLLLYAFASLIHFIHNAQFLPDYPGLPASWSAAGVYGAWVVMTVIGVTGWLVLSRGQETIGLLVLAVYASAGLDSLGHYVVAPFDAHTTSMNATILFEVTAAALVLIEVIRQLTLRWRVHARH